METLYVGQVPITAKAQRLREAPETLQGPEGDPIPKAKEVACNIQFMGIQCPEIRVFQHP